MGTLNGVRNLTTQFNILKVNIFEATTPGSTLCSKSDPAFLCENACVIFFDLKIHICSGTFSVVFGISFQFSYEIFDIDFIWKKKVVFIHLKPYIVGFTSLSTFSIAFLLMFTAFLSSFCIVSVLYAFNFS